VRSLRRRLLLSLWVSVVAVAVVSASIAYVQVSNRAKGLLDAQLEQIATLVAAHGTGKAQAARPEDSEIDVAIWNRDGALQSSSTSLMAEQHATQPGFTEILLNGEPYRLYTTILDGQHIEVAQPVDVRDDQAEAAALAALLPMLLLMPLLGIVIALVIRTLLQPVRNLAAAVSQRDIFAKESLPSQGLPKEVMPLVEEINRLLARQNAAAARERHFVEDAAHALRTPLAALQLQADVLDGSPDPTERSARLTDLRAGIQRASRLVDQLLSLANVESIIDDPGAPADVDATLLEVLALYAPAASAAQVSLEISGHAHAAIKCAPRYLILICSNLLDNALRYSPSGGRVELRAASTDAETQIEVWDQGPGLAQPELRRVFERFYRVAGDVRAGSGLGLATVEALVVQLGGRISLHNRTDHSGLIARVTLPCMEYPPT